MYIHNYNFEDLFIFDHTLGPKNFGRYILAILKEEENPNIYIQVIEL